VYYVYILESQRDPKAVCVGRSSDLRKRLEMHNEGLSPHTSKYRPWNLACYHAFADEQRAIEFERYLKSGSGREFRRRHFGL
jgi:putative endonuclease